MKLHIGQMYNRLDEYRNDVDADKMNAYMKGQFSFFGIKTKQRRALTKLHNKKLVLDVDELLPFAKICFAYPEREMHHYALDTIASFKKIHNAGSIDISEFFCEKNAWWDTVDMVNSLVNKKIFLNNRNLLHTKSTSWMQDTNFWKRRLAIIAQLKFKLETDTELLSKVIEANLGSNEFFINKAIGWALRDYGDHNPSWVLDYIKRTNLEPLSRREAIRKL